MFFMKQFDFKCNFFWVYVEKGAFCFCAQNGIWVKLLGRLRRQVLDQRLQERARMNLWLLDHRLAYLEATLSNQRVILCSFWNFSNRVMAQPMNLKILVNPGEFSSSLWIYSLQKDSEEIRIRSWAHIRHYCSSHLVVQSHRPPLSRIDD